MEAAEKPEVLWEHPELDSLHARLSDELELVERHRALERKLDVMSRAARVLLDLRLHARSLRVEWYIVALILIGIVISLYDLSGLTGQLLQVALDERQQWRHDVVSLAVFGGHDTEQVYDTPAGWHDEYDPRRNEVESTAHRLPMGWAGQRTAVQSLRKTDAARTFCDAGHRWPRAAHLFPLARPLHTCPGAMKHLVWLCAGVIFLFPPLAACGGGGDEVIEDIAVTLTTAGGATSVPSGGTLMIRANVTNATNTNVTWSLSGPNCPSNCGTIVPSSTDTATYTAPDDVIAMFTVTVIATSDEDTTKSGSVGLTVQSRVCPGMTSLLSGQYAFLLQGFDDSNRNGIATVGSFTADACGEVTEGSVDYYLGPGPTQSGSTTSLSGNYSIGDDHRGTLSFTLGENTVTFAIALGKISGGVASKGSLTESDPGASGIVTGLSGSMWLQDQTAFALTKIAGPFAFVFNGWNGSGPREAVGGTVTADGAGAFSGGLLDDNVFNGPLVTEVPWTGIYGAPSSRGRSVLTASVLTGSNGNAVIYVVNAGQLIVMISDASSGGRILSGNLIAQTGPFDLSSLIGNCVTYQTANYDQPGYEGLTFAALSLFTADGQGGLSGTVDLNSGGNIGHPSVQYTYAVDANGHASIYTVPSTVGGKWYLTGPNTGLMLGFDAGVSVGMILPQSVGPFAAASINGSYFASQAPGAAYGSTDMSGVATSAGNGTVATTMDSNYVGAVIIGQTSNGTYDFSPNGRALDEIGKKVIYVVDPDSFLTLDTNPASFYPVIQISER